MKQESDDAAWWLKYLDKHNAVLAHPLTNHVVRALVREGTVSATPSRVRIDGQWRPCVHVSLVRH